MKHILPLYSICLLMVSSCHEPYNVTSINELPAIYPNYIDVTIPYNIAPLNFAMADYSFSYIRATIKDADGDSIVAQGTEANFDIEQWHQILSQNKGKDISVSVCAQKNDKWYSFRNFNISISSFSLSDKQITYRRIAPGYGQYGAMGIYKRNVSDFSEQPIIVNSLSEGMCVNCHNSNRTNSQQFTFHVRGVNGATIVGNNNNVDILESINKITNSSLVYPSWHSTGRFIAFSTNQTAQMFHSHDINRIEVYDKKSDIVVYDVINNRLITDSIIMHNDMSENCPAFSANGDSLYFISAPTRNYPSEAKQQKYDLYRIAFDSISGHIYGNIDTIFSASDNGKSISWPSTCPRNQFITFAVADYGYFSIWHQESDIYIADLHSGVIRPINEICSNRAESYPKWSTDGRWLLFVSRRDDGLHSRLYISQLKDNGTFTKPFMLPQINPKQYYLNQFDSFNTPDFVHDNNNTDAKSIDRKLKNSDRKYINANN